MERQEDYLCKIVHVIRVVMSQSSMHSHRLLHRQDYRQDNVDEHLNNRTDQRDEASEEVPSLV